ncbi:hypothetical protein K488DRAFT_81933 [Vararia minispora EC-137]|uniref:Uncharacterized protein n=1 Tax=Vararia minispora EC-137 TaxID=1314806 RepID=A0ACB8QZJ7_9AGAM|nr:hypothetical protein K488DRAFT_81933 [Vararia minispora EC-137]
MAPQVGIDPPTETTHLLSRATTPSTAESSPSRFASLRPAISPAVSHLRTHGFRSFGENNGDSLDTADDAERAAYDLIVLLQLYIQTTRLATDGQDIWDEWAAGLNREDERKQIQQLIGTIWDQFISTARSSEELEVCLWTAFPLEKGGSRYVRVVDMVQDHQAPPFLLSHGLVTASLMRTWHSGLAVYPPDSTASHLRRVLERAVTPRILHALDLIVQFLYLGLLANYVLYPPSRPVVTVDNASVDTREILLLIYAMSNVLGLLNYILPCLLVALAFLSSLPASPVPGDGAYSTLLIGLFLHIILLHLPRAPNPCLLSPGTILPLSTLFFHEFSWTLYPAMLFFTPAFLVSLYLLTLSLVADSPVIPPSPGPSITAYLMVAPMEVREAFLALVVTILILMVFSACLLVLFSSSMRTSTNKWDHYSPSVGNKARRIFLAAIIRYVSPHYFPPPFNLLPVIFLYIPAGVLHLYGKRGLRAVRVIEAVFWWPTVGTCALVIAGCGLLVSSLSHLLDPARRA